MSNQLWPYPGSRWWKFDFHCHTPASSDYGAGPSQAQIRTRTCREWLNDYITAGIHCVAVTDHNCGDWIDPLKEELLAMKAEGVPGAADFHVFPGVELTIHGAHFLAIFDPSATTRTITDLLALARCNNDASNAAAYCTESVASVCEEVQRKYGLFIPAHVDLESTGIFKLQTNHSALDPILKLDGVVAMEVCDPQYAPPACYTDTKLNWTRILGSDSHHPNVLRANAQASRLAYPGSHFTWVKMATPSINALRLSLIDGKGVSIRRSDDSSVFNPFGVPDDFIEEIEIDNARYMGRGTPETLRFSPWLNSLIGGRGSGKSTVLQFLRLALRRDLDVLSLQSNCTPRTEFERFKRVAHGRNEEGAIKSDTKIRLTYRHEGARYRISWPEKEGEPSVEEWKNAGEAWGKAISQEVRDRFPIQIFSQGQIAALASEQSGALLRLVDESIDYIGWKELWNEKELIFFGFQNKIRELEAKLQSRDRILAQLEDVSRKLARFEEAEHAKVLNSYQSRSRQAKEHEQQSREARALDDRLAMLAYEIEVSAVPDGVFDAADPLAIEALTSIERIRRSITAAAETIRKTGEILAKIVEEEERTIADSSWKKDMEATKAAYEKLVVDLREQGVQDPSEYGQLLQDRQRLEGELKVFTALAETLARQKTKSTEALKDLQTHRLELSNLRDTFLRGALSDNEYVRIVLQPYGREPYSARDSLREVLGIDSNPAQFENDIFLRDEAGNDTDKGLIASMLANLPSENKTEEIKRRLDEIKAGLVRLATGGDYNEVSGYLKNRLRKTAETRPEFSDRILTWFPEDTLAVSYSPRGNGQDFRSIQQGSAGQRAAAMLAFLLAQGGEPIVVDQPEDDLDNQLIYRLVVQQMRANKQRRQIIAATHNPNIVVNGDAEMIHALDFQNGQCKVTRAGSLQEEDIREEICTVMEGGKEAFELRYRRIGRGRRPS